MIPQTHCRQVIPLGDGWPWEPGKGWGRLGPAGGLKAVPFTCLVVAATGQRHSWGGHRSFSKTYPWHSPPFLGNILSNTWWTLLTP